MKNCKHCSSSGLYVDWNGYYAVPVPCKYCNGTGWIDEDEKITIPRKYVKDDYFEDKSNQ